MARQAARAAVAFEFLEARMGDHDYLLASGFSAADIMLGLTLNIAKMFNIIDEEHFPKIAAYHKRLAARPALVKAQTRGFSWRARGGRTVKPEMPTMRQSSSSR